MSKQKTRLVYDQEGVYGRGACRIGLIDIEIVAIVSRDMRPAFHWATRCHDHELLEFCGFAKSMRMAERKAIMTLKKEMQRRLDELASEMNQIQALQSEFTKIAREAGFNL